MPVMTVEVVGVEAVEVEVQCDERCVWCEEIGDVAHTVDGFCECCGATRHHCL